MSSMAHIEPRFGEAPVTDAVSPVVPLEPPPVARRAAVLRWLLHDMPYITMLLLALVGVVLKLPFAYWLILMPLFGAISIGTGWSHAASRHDRLELVWRMALTWCALLLAIFLMFADSFSTVLRGSATRPEMMALLALGTFTAGIQAREWRICAVGGLLFLSVPALVWLHESPLLLGACVVVVIALGSVAWWLIPNRGRTE
jgi:hypothetical protein